MRFRRRCFEMPSAFCARTGNAVSYSNVATTPAVDALRQWQLLGAAINLACAQRSVAAHRRAAVDSSETDERARLLNSLPSATGSRLPLDYGRVGEANELWNANWT